MFGGYVRHFLGSRTWSKIKLIPYPLRSLTGNIIHTLPSKKIEELTNIQKNNYQKNYINFKTFKNIKNYDELYQSLLMQDTNYLYNDEIVNSLMNP